MKKNICSNCSKMKARRICLIKNNSLICSRCCAVTRNENCIECKYYAKIKEFENNKIKKRNDDNFIVAIDPEIENAVDNAMIFAEKGDVSKAEKLISNLFGLHPDNHSVLFAMGSLAALREKFRDAVFYLNKAVEIFPYFEEAWFNKGQAHIKLAELIETVEAFQKVIEIGDSSESFVQEAKRTLETIKKNIMKDSGLSLDKYIKNMKFYNVAFIDLQKGDIDKAITGFQKVLKTQEHYQSYGNLGICYAMLGRKDEAIKALNTALEIEPKYITALENKKNFLKLKDGEKLSIESIKFANYSKNNS